MSRHPDFYLRFRTSSFWTCVCISRPKIQGCRTKYYFYSDYQTWEEGRAFTTKLECAGRHPRIIITGVLGNLTENRLKRANMRFLIEKQLQFSYWTHTQRNIWTFELDQKTVHSFKSSSRQESAHVRFKVEEIKIASFKPDSTVQSAMFWSIAPTMSIIFLDKCIDFC